MTRKGWLVVAVVILALVFAVQGGDYSTADLITLRRQVKQERAAIAGLKVDIDSLSRLARALERDPAVQELSAREEFGMIKRGEFLYRLVPADTMNDER